MSHDRYLTGITTTGTPHLGNYTGAIRPAIAASHDATKESFYFLADYHAIVKCRDPVKVHASSREIAATWLALGLDVNNAVFYRQSDVPEIMELCWILTCLTAKGLMNRAHAYKAAVAENEQAEQGPDYGITMGLYSYPVLMAADILMFRGHHIPVGRDQIQHVEMARDIAQRFNHHYGELFVLPEVLLDDAVTVLPGLDGRKMSKSYDNTIPLFLPPKQLQKAINKIKTNLLEPGEPKDPNGSAVFQIYEAFATPEQCTYMREQFAAGIAWGQAKKELCALIDGQVGVAREEYERLMADSDTVERVLRQGAEQARNIVRPFLQEVRSAIGIRSLSG